MDRCELIPEGREKCGLMIGVMTDIMSSDVLQTIKSDTRLRVSLVMPLSILVILQRFK